MRAATALGEGKKRTIACIAFQTKNVLLVAAKSGRVSASTLIKAKSRAINLKVRPDIGLYLRHYVWPGQ
jgi:hypothetical protein